MRVKVRFEGIEEALAGLCEEAIDSARVAVALHASRVAEGARSTHPYTDRTGNLTESIEALDTNREGDFVRGYVVAGMDYASFVEEGTSRMHARPYLSSAAERLDATLGQTAEEELEGAADRAGWTR